MLLSFICSGAEDFFLIQTGIKHLSFLLYVISQKGSLIILGVISPTPSSSSTTFLSVPFMRYFFRKFSYHLTPSLQSFPSKNVSSLTGNHDSPPLITSWQKLGLLRSSDIFVHPANHFYIGINLVMARLTALNIAAVTLIIANPFFLKNPFKLHIYIGC